MKCVCLYVSVSSLPTQDIFSGLSAEPRCGELYKAPLPQLATFSDGVYESLQNG